MSHDTKTELSELSDAQLAQHLRQCALPLIDEMIPRDYFVKLDVAPHGIRDFTEARNTLAFESTFTIRREVWL